MRRIVAVAALALLATACDSGPTDSRVGAALVEEQLAYHIGVIAYLYGYPMVDMYRRMHNQTHRVDPDQTHYSPLNTLAYLDDRSWRGWVDLGSGTVSLRALAPPGTELNFRVKDLYGCLQRTRIVVDATGIVGINLRHGPGDYEAGSTALPVRTPLALLQVESSRALGEDAVSLSGTTAAAAEVRVVPLSPMRSLGYFEVLNMLLRTLPLETGDRRLLEQFDTIGVGPHTTFSMTDLSPAHKRGLERAIRDARTMLDAASAGSIPGGLLGRAAAYARTAGAVSLIGETQTAADSR